MNPNCLLVGRDVQILLASTMIILSLLKSRIFYSTQYNGVVHEEILTCCKSFTVFNKLEISNNSNLLPKG